MASTINADNGVVSGSAGLKSTADASGVLALQSNGTTGLTLNTSLAVGVGSGGATYGTSGQVLTSGGSGAAPSWSTLTVSGSGGATASGSVTLTSASGGAQSITTTDYGQYVKLPDATTMTKAACVFTVNNKGGYPLKVLNNSGSVLGFLYPGDTSIIGLSDSSTAAGVWDCSNLDILAITGMQTYQAVYVLRDQIELDSTRTFFLMNVAAGTYGQVFDSSTATWGTLTLIRSGNAGTTGRAWLVGTDKVLVWTDVGTGRSAVALTFSGTTITVNTAATATITAATTQTRLTIGSTYVLIQVGYVTAFTVSGTTVTIGTQTAVSAGTSSYGIAFSVSASSGLVITGTSSNSLQAYAFTLSGTTPTIGTVLSIASAGISVSSGGLKAAAIGSQWIAAFRTSDTNNPVGASILSVSGTTVTASNISTLLPLGAFNSTSLDSIYVSGNKALIGVRATNWLGFNIVTNTAGTASIGTEWTTSIGSINTAYLSFTSGTTAYYTTNTTYYTFAFSVDMSGSSPSVTYISQIYGRSTDTTSWQSTSGFSRSFQGSIGVGLVPYTSQSSYVPITVINASKFYSFPSKIYTMGLEANMDGMTIASSLSGSIVGNAAVTGTSFWGLNNTNWIPPSTVEYGKLVKIETIT